MVRDLNSAELAMVLAALRTCGSASILGCVGVLVIYAGRAKERRTEIGVHMVVILQLFELVKALFMTIGPAGANLPGFCTTQAAFIEFSSLCAVMWTCCLASNLRLLLTRKRKADALERRLRLQLVLTIVPSIVLSCIILGIGDFKNTRYWCWVDDGQHSEFHAFTYFNLWVVLALVFIAVTLIQVWQVEPDLETRDGIRALQLTFVQYMTVFIATSIFGVITFFVQVSEGRSLLWASLLNTIFIPLPGFLNALVYVGFFEYLGKRNRATSGRASAATTEMQDMFDPANVRRSTEWTSNSLRLNNPTADRQIFVTTFNMGECRIEDISNIDKWMPKNYDVYAIGVQECLVLSELRDVLLQHIGSSYTMFTHEIGSNNTSLGFHGMIALTVFARTSDVRAGRFCQEHVHEVNQGKKIGTHRLQNKGTVGLSFRYHDTSLAFLTTHLPSDSNGKCKVHKRDKGANKALARTVLVEDDIGCSVQLQHHHVFFLGDLNYRMKATNPEVTLEKLADVCALEFEGRTDGGAAWREERLRMFDISEQRARAKSEKSEHRLKMDAAWKGFCEADELEKSLGSDHVFYGFREMPICFPPTYRRSRDVDGGDYSSMEFLSQTFTTRVFKTDEKEVKAADNANDTTEFNPVLANEEGADEKGTPRVPSYTDRILVHSLQDRESGLKLNAYESYENIRGSDHRPVGLWCTLKVSPTVLRPMDASKADSLPFIGRKASKRRMSALEASNQLQLQVTLKCLSCNILSPKEAKKATKALHKVAAKKSSSDVSLEAKGGNGISRPIDGGEIDEAGKEQEEESEDDDGNNGVFGDQHEFSDSESGEEYSDDDIDEKSGSSDGKIARVEFVLPVPTEDPRLNQRKDNEILSAFGSKENRAKLARLRRETGTVLQVEYDLANTTKASWKNFEAKGMQITADVRPEFGLHGLVKVLNKSGETLGSGVLCLRELMRRQDSQDALMGATQVEDVALVVGGQLRGSIHLSVNCQKLKKLAPEFAVPENDPVNRETSTF